MRKILVYLVCIVAIVVTLPSGATARGGYGGWHHGWYGGWGRGGFGWGLPYYGYSYAYYPYRPYASYYPYSYASYPYSYASYYPYSYASYYRGSCYRTVRVYERYGSVLRRIWVC